MAFRPPRHILFYRCALVYNIHISWPAWAPNCVLLAAYVIVPTWANICGAMFAVQCAICTMQYVSGA
eukprot:4138359-Pyramimonas_sp.AAC.1